MTDLEFMDQAEAVLRAVERCCDRINEQTDADIDNQRVGGMVTLVFANRSQIVVNLQKPLHEIWLASRSGGYHFRFDGQQWADTKGQVTHFVSAMGTTGTISGVSQFLREKNPAVKIIGAQPSEGSRIPGIRKWPQEYMPKIYDPKAVDELILVSQSDAEEMCRRMAREEGIFAGISAAGACWVAQQIAQREKNATIVFIVCDRGDRYLSTGVFPA